MPLIVYTALTSCVGRKIGRPAKEIGLGPCLKTFQSFSPGTRWMQELVWRVRNDQDAKSTEYLNVRVPMLE